MSRSPIPDDVLTEAERLRTEGHPWAYVSQVCHYSTQGLRAALDRRGYQGPTRAESTARRKAEKAELTVEAVRLTVDQDLSPSEIAEVVGTSAQSVRACLGSRAGQRLLREARKESEDAGALIGGSWRFHPGRRVHVWVPRDVA